MIGGRDPGPGLGLLLRPSPAGDLARCGGAGDELMDRGSGFALSMDARAPVRFGIGFKEDIGLEIG